MGNESEIIQVQPLPFTANFGWSTGSQMQRFIGELADKRILGAKCPGCGYTYVPPRSRCGKCYAGMGEEDLIPLSGKGTLVSYTTAHVRLDGQGEFQDLEKPEIIGAIRLDNTDSTIFMILKGGGTGRYRVFQTCLTAQDFSSERGSTTWLLTRLWIAAMRQ